MTVITVNGSTEPCELQSQSARQPTITCLPAGDATAMRERTAPAPAGPPRRTVRTETTAPGWRDDRRGIVKLSLHACRTELLSLRAGRRCSQSQYERSGRQSESEFSHKTSP